ncbi:hypothetical protein GQ42DRAFT_22319 [Ramicandelaber brevisporus]|nr:hypothetical protein GQ42DRAFT_22319 [Ramicandelaber brevisporus]
MQENNNKKNDNNDNNNNKRRGKKRKEEERVLKGIRLYQTHCSVKCRCDDEIHFYIFSCFALTPSFFFFRRPVCVCQPNRNLGVSESNKSSRKAVTSRKNFVSSARLTNHDYKRKGCNVQFGI